MEAIPGSALQLPSSSRLTGNTEVPLLLKSASRLLPDCRPHGNKLLVAICFAIGLFTPCTGGYISTIR